MPDQSNPFVPQKFQGQFADDISGLPRQQPQQPPDFSGFISKKGAALGLIDNFIQGISKGKLVASARNEQKSHQAVKDSDQLYEFMMSSDKLSKAGKDYISENYLKARARGATQQLAEQLKAMPKDQKQTPQGHMLHAVHSAFENMTGGPVDKQEHGAELSQQLVGLWKTAKTKPDAGPGGPALPALGRADTYTDAANRLLDQARQKAAAIPEEQRHYAFQQMPEVSKATDILRKALPEKQVQERLDQAIGAYKKPEKTTADERLDAKRHPEATGAQPPTATAQPAATGAAPPVDAKAPPIAASKETPLDRAMEARPHNLRSSPNPKGMMVNGEEKQVIFVSGSREPNGNGYFDAQTGEKIPADLKVTDKPKPDTYKNAKDAHGNAVQIDNQTGKARYVAFDDAGKSKLVEGVPKSQTKTAASDGSKVPMTEPKAWSPKAFSTKQGQEDALDGLTLAAWDSIYSGKPPSAVGGAKGNERYWSIENRKAKIMNDLGLTTADLVTIPASLKANSGALTYLTKQQTNFRVMETTLQNNAKVLQDLSKKYDRTDTPFINRVKTYLDYGTGADDVVGFMGQLEVVVQEASAIQAAASGSGRASVSDKKAAREIIKTSLTDKGINEYVATLQKDIASKKNAFDTTKAQIMEEIRSGATVKLGGAKEPPASKASGKEPPASKADANDPEGILQYLPKKQ